MRRDAEPEYEVYIFRYGTGPSYPLAGMAYRMGDKGEIVKDLTLSYWGIIGNGKKIIFDTGVLNSELAKDWFGVTDFETPRSMLAKIDLTPEEITDVVISHIHRDHSGNIRAFPNAKIWIQREELEFAAGRSTKTNLQTAKGIPFDDVLEIVKLNAAGRVELIEGDQILFPGVNVYVVPQGHTWASQFMVVNTKTGSIVLASDNADLWLNIEKNIPGGIGYSLWAMENGIKRMKSFVKDTKDIIPGHDPKIFDVYKPIAPGVAKVR